MVHARDKREVAREQAVTALEQDFAFLEVETAGSDVLARRGRCRHRHGIAVARGVFLNDDGVGAFRHDATRKNPRGFALADGARERPSGRNFADDLETGRDLRDVGGAGGVAIHRRHRRRRLGAARGEVGGEHAAVGFL